MNPKDRPILTSAVQQRPEAQMAGSVTGGTPQQVYDLHSHLEHPCEGSWQQELPECALGPHSLRHTISYSNLNGQEQIQETEVTCSGDDCETTTSNVLPQIIRVREPKAKRMCSGVQNTALSFQFTFFCSGSPGLIWDGLDTVVHRVTNSARRVLGYAPVETEKTPHENLQPLALRSEGVMKMYTYSNNNGQEELGP
eukprot:g33457.t1